MGVKLLLALLTVMLVILLVFNSFGIAYNRNDFMGTMITVESGFGQVSDFALKAFDKVKEFVLSGADLLGSFYDATLGKFVKWIEETYDISVLNLLSDSITHIVNMLKESSLIWNFISEEGFNIFNSDWQSRFTVFSACLHSPEFWVNYKNRDEFLWNKYAKYRDAYLYGADNEYSYLISRDLNKNIFNYVDSVPKNTVVSTSRFKFYSKDVILWFNTISLSIPDEYCPFLSENERIIRYYSDVIPVFDSNYTYTYHDYDCTLTGIVINYDTEYKIFLGSAPVDNSRYGAYFYTFYINNKPCMLDLIFTYIGPGGKKYNITIKYGDYISDHFNNIFIGPDKVQVLDYVAY